VLHRILPMCVPAVDPAWQLEVSPVRVRLREQLLISAPGSGLQCKMALPCRIRLRRLFGQVPK
jgi:hypothetical protein